jgi:hypothetical protein
MAALVLNVLALPAGLDLAAPWLRRLAPVLVLLFLAGFVASRVRTRVRALPGSFVFIPLGLLVGMAGSHQGAMLCLILGLRLAGEFRAATERWLAPAAAVTLAISHGLEFTGASWAGFLRAGVFTVFAASAVSTLWPRIATWSLALGLWTTAVAGLVAPAFKVHFAHLVFVSGFGMLTLAAASRVLGDGGPRAWRWIGGLLLAAAATRVFAPFVPAVYESHLAYASIAWLAALLLWIRAFGAGICGKISA